MITTVRDKQRWYAIRVKTIGLTTLTQLCACAVMTTETVDRYKEKRVKSGGRLSTFDQSVRVEGA